MRNLIKKILKEDLDFNSFDWVDMPEIEARATPIKEFLYNLMNNLEMSESKSRPGWVVYKNKKGQILMADNINVGGDTVLWVDKDKIWKRLENRGLTFKEIEEILINVLDVNFSRKVNEVHSHRSKLFNYLNP